MAFVYITFENKTEAKKAAEHLLSKRLIACANFFPVDSMYWWEGKIRNDNEYVMFAKTREEKFEEIKKEVKKIHSYDIPCICLLDAQETEEYAEWVKKEVHHGTKAGNS